MVGVVATSNGIVIFFVGLTSDDGGRTSAHGMPGILHSTPDVNSLVLVGALALDSYDYGNL